MAATYACDGACPASWNTWRALDAGLREEEVELHRDVWVLLRHSIQLPDELRVCVSELTQCAVLLLERLLPLRKTLAGAVLPKHLLCPLQSPLHLDLHVHS